MIGQPARGVCKIPYRDDFQRTRHNHQDVSPTAFVRLGWEKGYRLVRCQRDGFNAFFLRSDVGADLLPEIPAEECYRHEHARSCMVSGNRDLEHVQ